MTDLPEFDEILDLAKELKAEQPKSRQGVKAAGRRARKILVKIRELCPVVRRELRDSVVHPMEKLKVSGTVHEKEAESEKPPKANPPNKKPRTDEQLGRHLDLSDD